MKKVAVVVLAVAFLMMAFAALPVLAEPTKGQKVEVTSIFVPPPQIPIPGVGEMNKGGIFHAEGRVEVFPNNLLFIGTDPVPLTVYAYLIEMGSWNSKTGIMVLHNDVVWYISSEGSPDGFAGNEELKLFGFDLTTGMFDSMQMHTVLHGFGYYAGQTLMLSYKGPANVVSTGYLLKG